MPDASEVTIGILAVMAMHERRLISDRTRAALQAAKKNGTIKGQGFFGNPCIYRGEKIPGSGDPINAAKATAAKVADADEFAMDMIEVIREMGGGSLREIADGLNNADFKTARGKEWTAIAVKRVMDRAAALEESA